MDSSLRRKQSQIKNLKMRGTMEMEDDQSILQQILKAIDNLYEMRLIQKISRPIEKKLKLQIINQYAKKMDSLHFILNKIKTQAQEKSSDNGNNQKKSNLGSIAQQSAQYKKRIRNIQSKYSQVFVDGSFKHYKKIALMNNFQCKLQRIDIQQWALTCLNNVKTGQSCC